jgi:hypothetical protein
MLARPFGPRRRKMELVLLDSFKTKQEAIGLISLLDENNIPFIQKSEDGGGKFGGVLLTSGVKVFISKEDIEKVQKIINR